LEVLLFIFFAVVGIQVIYFILYNIALSKPIVDKSSQQLPVSVIICAHDEEKNLRELIPMLLSQNHPEFEIVVVDDRSNDGTFDFLLQETAKDHRLRMVHVNRTPQLFNNKKYALTLGIKAAKYEWLLLTDADCRPSSQDWIGSFSKHFSDATQFIVGFSPYQFKPGFLNAFIRYETLMTGIQYISFALLGTPYMGVGRNLAYRRSKFLEVKGFNNFTKVTGGDDDLFINQHARKANTALCLEANAITTSIPKTTFRSFFQQKVRHLSVGKYYRFGHRLMLGLFAFSWLMTWFLGIPLAIFSGFYYVVIGLLILRLILIMITFNIAAKKLHQKVELWMVPLLDFIYAFYYLVTGIKALGTKKVRWKN
jgi:cellulose synthase/poly-beta-1,6-N-acetylglucosamine synthase-like glycosyltransferase